MRLKALIEKVETDLPTGQRQLRSMTTGQLLDLLKSLLRMTGLSEADISTFTAMEPKKALELLRGVIRKK